LTSLPKIEMRSQVFEICSDNYISIKFIKPHQRAEASFEDSTIYVYPIKSTKSYATCLHEIGHLIVVGAISAWNKNDDLGAEAYAWRWARSVALVWNDTASRYMNACLKSYLDDAEEPPPQTHIFWRVYGK
jgi:hypothetical protein